MSALQSPGLESGNAPRAPVVTAKKPDDAETKRWKTSLDFQTMFLTQMYKSMRQTIAHDELSQPSFARETFTEMFDGEIAATPSRSPFESGPMGLLAAQTGQSTSLAAAVYRSMRQSGATAAPTPGAKALAAQDLDPLIRQAAQQYDLSPNLLSSVIHAESGNNPKAVSPKGAKGLMQLMDTTAADMGVQNPFDPRENVLGGARYLRTLLDRFGGDERKALAGYNAGPAAVDRYRGVPPFPETKHYVDTVTQHRDLLDAQGGKP